MNIKKTVSIIAGTILIILMTACEKGEVSPGNTEGTDVDLTALSATMVYSEVYNMMMSPMDYVGKTVKMSGTFTTFINEEDGRYIFGCVITDATACCAQGIEFELTDDYRYPEDYPKDGDTICVTGTFDTYQEDEFTYCTLRNAKLL